jgi:hypothetical protein
MWKWLLSGLAVVLLVVAAGAGYFAWRYYSPEPPDVAFVMADEELQDPDEPWRRHVIDFAELEHQYPLSPEDRIKITPDSLRALSQEQVDQIYGRLPAGPIPDGVFHGGLFFPKGEEEYSRLGELVGGILGRKADVAVSKLEFFASRLWKGKVFDRDNLVLRNLVEDREFLEELIGDDAAQLETIEVERFGPLSWILPTRTTWLLFPAKLYCGQSLLDGRRESIIIDYAYNDDLTDLYRDNPDNLVGRKGMRIRDEIRMVRPGFYLGRAYLNRVFALNFTLYNPEIAEAQEGGFLAGESVGADCWPEAEQLSASAG